MIPPLIHKAVTDAGFDLLLGAAAEWERIGVSGLESEVWVLPVHAGAFVALGNHAILQEFTEVTWTDVPLPRVAEGALRCQTQAELYAVLRRVRVLIAQVKQRVGQVLFRDMLMEYWNGRCAVTGLDVPELLRASHAKPWTDANDNGLLLAVHLDALFDQGLMTFNHTVPLSSARGCHRKRWDCWWPRQRSLGFVEWATHRPYLEYHRRVVFQ